MALLAAMLAAPLAWAQATPNFSGTWKQDNDRCVPPRKGEVTLRIDHREPDLTVETTMVRGAAAPRHASQHYSTDGKVSVTTGADGDEFHTSILWHGQSLIFLIEEHEDERVILSTETWTLIDGGAALERVRQPAGGGEKQTLVYLRQTPQS